MTGAHHHLTLRVHGYDHGAAYEVEFFLDSGETVAVLTLEANDVRPRGGKEILHGMVRERRAPDD